MAARLKSIYETELKKKMMEKFKYSNIHQIPKLEKIIVNSVTREAVSNGKIVEQVVDEIATVTGQKPVVARAKKSIASFKLREGQAIGAFVTLRGEQMYEFLDRLIAASLPRIRDFKGVNNKGFDGNGNYTLGVSEQIIFPEIDIDKVAKIQGMDITFVTSAKTDKEAHALLTEFGIPFKK